MFLKDDFFINQFHVYWRQIFSSILCFLFVHIMYAKIYLIRDQCRQNVCSVDYNKHIDPTILKLDFKFRSVPKRDYSQSKAICIMLTMYACRRNPTCFFLHRKADWQILEIIIFSCFIIVWSFNGKQSISSRLYRVKDAITVSQINSNVATFIFYFNFLPTFYAFCFQCSTKEDYYFFYLYFK